MDTEGTLAAVAARLAAEFPEYAALASPKPLNAEEVQNLLGPEEALVLLPGGRQGELRLCADARGVRMEDDPARRGGALRRRSPHFAVGSMSMRCGADCNGWSARKPRRTSAASRAWSAIGLSQRSAKKPDARARARGLRAGQRPARAVRSRARARALRNAHRSGRGADPGQAASHRGAVGRAHGAAVPSAGDGEAGSGGAAGQDAARSRGLSRRRLAAASAMP